ncbi:MAG: hypothetical protein Q8L56_02460 [Rhodocyclaceae bacterium]|nr:hypothetical protein [Rhodocyclaceae bacterium]
MTYASKVLSVSGPAAFLMRKRQYKPLSDSGNIPAIIAAVLMSLSSPTYADDPCSDTDREASSIMGSLQPFNRLIAKDGKFHVKKIGEYGQTPSGLPSFEVAYEARGQTLFRQNIAHPPLSVADVLVIKPLRTKDGAKLGLAYGMGAGGRISCEYKVYDNGGRFLAKRGAW